MKSVLKIVLIATGLTVLPPVATSLQAQTEAAPAAPPATTAPAEEISTEAKASASGTSSPPSSSQAAEIPKPQAVQPTVDHTITLTKVVGTKAQEDPQVTVDQYQFQKGDGLLKVLRKRGLVRSQADEGRMLRLVKKLNPSLTDPNKLTIGQTLNLPAVASAEAVAQGQAKPLSAYEKAAVEPSGNQASSSVASDLNFPSGNPGVLAQDQASGVVYRQVEVRRGDTLEKLLLREGMDRDFVYSHLLKVVVKLNPDLADTNKILTGTQLRIPAAGDYLTALGGIDPAVVRRAAVAQAPGGGGAAAPTQVASATQVPAKAPEVPTETTPSTAPDPQEVTETAVEPPVETEAAPSVAEESQIAEVAAPQADAQPAVLALPDKETEAAKSSLGILFTRLGNTFRNSGYLSLAAGNANLEIDTGLFPVVETADKGNIILDLGSRLPQSTLDALRRYQPTYQVWRTAPEETLGQAMDRLLALGNFYRIYTRKQAYEGGGDIRLKITADWIVWPTQEAWNAGQPLVISALPPESQGTDPIWANFLETHGFKMLDLQGNIILPAPPKLPPRDLTMTLLDRSSEVIMASQLVLALGFQPQLQVPIKELGLDAEGQPLKVPLLWESETGKVAMNFGDLSQANSDKLTSLGFKVINSGSSTEAVIGATLIALGIKPETTLVLTAPPGGPDMSLTIRGLAFKKGEKQFLITQSPLTSGLASLAGDNLVVLKY